MVYTGTNEPIRLYDWVSWYCDENSKGYILNLDSGFFSVCWDDIGVKLYPTDFTELLRKLA